MRPHGHSIHPLTIFLFLWPVLREPSFGKEIWDAKRGRIWIEEIDVPVLIIMVSAKP